MLAWLWDFLTDWESWQFVVIMFIVVFVERSYRRRAAPHSRECTVYWRGWVLFWLGMICLLLIMIAGDVDRLLELAELQS